MKEKDVVILNALRYLLWNTTKVTYIDDMPHELKYLIQDIDELLINSDTEVDE